MHKVFMNVKEVQEFLEVSRTTAYQLINEMNQELINLGYRVQRGKVNRSILWKSIAMAEILRKRCNMGAYKDEAKNGTWFCKFTYTNWKGEKLTKKKRGFAAKKDALNWERKFLIAHSYSVEMTFREFFELYRRDK